MGITGLLRFWHTYTNLSRIRQIVNVLLKHGFGLPVGKWLVKRTGGRKDRAGHGAVLPDMAMAHAPAGNRDGRRAASPGMPKRRADTVRARPMS